MKFPLLKIKSWKRKNDLLKNKFEIVLNEKNDLSKSFEKMKMDFEIYKTAYKGKSPSITNNKKWIFENSKTRWGFGYYFKKMCIWHEQNCIYVSHGKNPKETHSSYIKHIPWKACTFTSTQACIYVWKNIYTCAHYGRKGHLAKFYYAKLNIINKNVYVRENTDPIGPKKI